MIYEPIKFVWSHDALIAFPEIVTDYQRAKNMEICFPRELVEAAVHPSVKFGGKIPENVTSITFGKVEHIIPEIVIDVLATSKSYHNYDMAKRCLEALRCKQSKCEIKRAATAVHSLSCQELLSLSQEPDMATAWTIDNFDNFRTNISDCTILLTNNPAFQIKAGLRNILAMQVLGSVASPIPKKPSIDDEK